MEHHEAESETNRGRRSTPVNRWLVAVLLLLVGVLVFRMLDRVQPGLLDPNARSRTITPRGDLASSERSTIELYSRARSSVVHITNIQLARDRVSLDITRIPQGTGTGFIWDDQGHVVTNYHVIENAQEVSVNFGGGKAAFARLVGYAADKDLAVLKVDVPKSGLNPIDIGKSSDLQVGQSVFAIGNPFGLDQTLTTGVISGLGREILSVTQQPIQGVIQTDAAINPGNSGGPLLDSAGRLVGVNTAIYSPSGTYAGIGFAVPVDMVNHIVPQLIRTGRVDRAGIGVSLWPDATVEQLRKDGVLKSAGALVLDIVEDSGAAQAKMNPTRRRPDGRMIWGDLVTAVDGKKVETILELLRLLGDRKVNDKVILTIEHDSKQRDLEVTLQALK
jgi:S1-C subfamily serine protease